VKSLHIGVLMILLTAMPASAQDISYAWWVEALFEPRAESVEGVPVRDLDGRWMKASVLRAADLPSEARERGKMPDAYGFSLAVEADLDGDGNAERAVVGVFRGPSGETGRFLLILGRSKPGAPWTKRALFSETGTPGFSAIAVKHRALEWVTCFECDTSCEIQYRWWRFRKRCHTCC
jgi:hypothetical protein